MHMNQIFDGLRIVELANTEAGARLTQFFADYGADVLMVEPPGGARTRRQPGWPSLGRGKRSLVLDLQTSAGRAELREQLAGADVLVETFRPGVLGKLGLGDDALRELNPRLITTSITGFGRYGPWAGLKGFEAIVMAKLGAYWGFSRGVNRPGPAFTAVPYCSYGAAQIAIQGTLAALLERESSGQGQRVEANLAQAFATFDCWAWFERMIAERYPDAIIPVGAYDHAGNPNTYKAFTLLVAATSDHNWMQFAQLQSHLFSAFLHLLGLEDVEEDPEYSGLPIFDSVEKRVALLERLLGRVADFSLEQWNDMFEAEPNVFAEVFRDGPEVLNHPVLRDQGWVAETQDATYGHVRQLSRLVRVVDEPDWVPGPAPALAAGPFARGSEPAPPFPDVPGKAASGRTPLDGVTILDLAVWYASPYGTALLTDLGARVIHIEPLKGDPIRMAAGFPEIGGMKVMQGKESIALDISAPEGRKIVAQLVAQSDAVLHSFRSGVAARLGVDVDSLRQINPRLVYLDATGYGTTGPYGYRPSYAPSIAAAAGLTLRNAGKSVAVHGDMSMPQRRNIASRLAALSASISTNADGLSALAVATAMMLGLYAQRRGRTVHLETTMLSSTAHVNFGAVTTHDGDTAMDPDEELLGYSALYRLYETSEGWVFLAAPGEKDWSQLVRAVASQARLDDIAEFATPELRTANDVALAELLADVFRKLPASEWEAILTRADVGCVECPDVSTEGRLMGAEARESGYVADVTHPIFEEHPRISPVVRFSRSATVARPSCLAGEYTDKILAELGYSPAEITDLRARSVVA
jgi:crotonobetainyl-CoA:carnitine CoA-transferase CaiB-like acyl-CoA transferase